MENKTYITKFTFDQLKENFDKLNGYILKYFSDKGEYWKNKSERLFEMHNDLADKIMLAPASSSPIHHAAYIGGYVIHTQNVIKFSIATYKLWKQAGVNLDDEMLNELIFAAAVHDLGKIGNKEHDQYIPESSDWHVKNQLKYYRKNLELPFMPIRERTMWLLQKYQIELSENEYIAILVHDGLYDEANKQYYMAYDADKKFKTAIPYILHHADMLATRLEFEQWLIPYKNENTKEQVEAQTKKEELDHNDKKQQLVTEYSKLFGD